MRVKLNVHLPAILHALLLLAVMEVRSMEFFTLRRSFFRDVIGPRMGVLSDDDVEKRVEEYADDESPVERNVDVNIFLHQLNISTSIPPSVRTQSPSVSPSMNTASSDSSMPSEIPSDTPSVIDAPSGSSMPSIIPSDIPSVLMAPSLPSGSWSPSNIPSDIPSYSATGAPTLYGGVPVTLPPIPFLPISTTPPFNFDLQPVTLPPILIVSATTRPPNEVTRPPPTTTPPTGNGAIPSSPTVLQPIIISPIGVGTPTTNTPSLVISPSSAAVSNTPTLAPNGNETLTIEQFLAQTLTDDGSIQEAGTPQYRALTQLKDTNPELDPKNVDDQSEIKERYALLTLYYATEGDAWAVNTLWGTADPPCSTDGTATSNWVGLTCETVTGRQVVSGLSLRDNNMQGQLPSEIRGLTQLRTCQ